MMLFLNLNSLLRSRRRMVAHHIIRIIYRKVKEFKKVPSRGLAFLLLFCSVGKRKRNNAQEQVDPGQSKSFKGLMESYQSSKLRNELLSSSSSSSSTYQESPSSKYPSSSSSSSSSKIGKGKVHFSTNTKVVEDDSNEKTNDYSASSSPGVSSQSPVSQVVIDDALQNMLMAWYHSGYATGRYQTLCELNQNQLSSVPSNNSDSNENVSYETS
jgi:hypothetical protein